MIAEIASGNNDTADVFFLIALIVFVVAAASHFVARAATYASVLVPVGLACVSLAFLVL